MAKIRSSPQDSSSGGEDRKNVKISPAAFEPLDRLMRELGMRQSVIVERLLIWLASQPDYVRRQFVIPGGDPADAMCRQRDVERAARSGVSMADAIEDVKSATAYIEARGREMQAELERLKGIAAQLHGPTTSAAPPKPDDQGAP